nr:hypothetical protein [uncultured Cellulosilyticum sp.]
MKKILLRFRILLMGSTMIIGNICPIHAKENAIQNSQVIINKDEVAMKRMETYEDYTKALRKSKTHQLLSAATADLNDDGMNELITFTLYDHTLTFEVFGYEDEIKSIDKIDYDYVGYKFTGDMEFKLVYNEETNDYAIRYEHKQSSLGYTLREMKYYKLKDDKLQEHFYQSFYDNTERNIEPPRGIIKEEEYMDGEKVSILRYRQEINTYKEEKRLLKIGIQYPKGMDYTNRGGSL